MDGTLVKLTEARRRPTIPQPRMLPEQLEQLAAVVYAAAAEYGWRCLGEPPLPAWSRADDATRELWMRRIARELDGRMPRASRGVQLELSEIRRYRLVSGVVAALTAAA